MVWYSKVVPMGLHHTTAEEERVRVTRDALLCTACVLSGELCVSTCARVCLQLCFWERARLHFVFEHRSDVFQCSRLV